MAGSSDFGKAKLVLVCRELGEKLSVKSRVTHLWLGRGQRVRALRFFLYATKPGSLSRLSLFLSSCQVNGGSATLPGWLEENVPRLRFLSGRYLDLAQIREFRGLGQARLDLLGSQEELGAFFAASAASLRVLRLKRSPMGFQLRVSEQSQSLENVWKLTFRRIIPLPIFTAFLAALHPDKLLFLRYPESLNRFLSGRDYASRLRDDLKHSPAITTQLASFRYLHTLVDIPFPVLSELSGKLPQLRNLSLMVRARPWPPPKSEIPIFTYKISKIFTFTKLLRGARRGDLLAGRPKILGGGGMKTYIRH